VFAGGIGSGNRYEGSMTRPGLDRRLADSLLWQESPWARLRYIVTEANLRRHLDPSPQRVLDVAGGSGLDAVRLAARGHEVTVLDPAGAMLRSAKEHAESFDVADRLYVVQASAEDAPELFGPDDFDVVLCHNLLQYVEDAHALLAAITAPLRPGGLLSVLAPNPDSDPMHLAIRDFDPGRALLAMDLPAPTATDAVTTLVELGFGLIVRYGVRCVADYIPNDELKQDAEFFDELERLELAMADRMPYLLTARYFHLLARR
jgi:S-adenosylmethionine-dependent methyltransferase